MFCLEGESIQEDWGCSEAVEFTTDLLCIPSILNACVYINIYIYIFPIYI